MDDDLDAGLFGISLSDSEDAGAEPSEQSKIESQQNGGRTGQSEAAFQDVKSSYHVKIENGEIWKNVNLPNFRGVTKPEAQEVLHAAEELYFFRRYDEVVDYIRNLFRTESIVRRFDKDTREMLEHYEAKSLHKLADTGYRPYAHDISMATPKNRRENLAGSNQS